MVSVSANGFVGLPCMTLRHACVSSVYLALGHTFLQYVHLGVCISRYRYLRLMNDEIIIMHFSTFIAVHQLAWHKRAALLYGTIVVRFLAVSLPSRMLRLTEGLSSLILDHVMFS